MTLINRLLLTVSLLGISSFSYANTLASMLEKMSSAAKNRNYQGTFILLRSGKLSTLRVSHGMDKRGVWERLDSLNGEPRTVIRQNKEVISIFPKKKLLTIRKYEGSLFLQHKLPNNLERLKKYYRFDHTGHDRVAGYKTFVLDLVPKDKYRYGYRYWLEDDTGMLLRCDLLNTHQKIIEQMMFTRLKYLSKVPTMAFKAVALKKYTVKNLDDAARPVKPLTWEVTNAPVGFKLIQSHYRQLTSSAKLLQLVYSDGLSSVSVFIEKMNNKEQHLVGDFAMGAVHAYGVHRGDYYITVVGEAPALTVMQMAKTTRHFGSAL